MTNMNRSKNVLNYSFYDKSDKMKIVVCDKVKGRLFEASANSLDAFISGMIRLGYKNFTIKASGFFVSDEYFCILN
jgi:hypothetical protein